MNKPTKTLIKSIKAILKEIAETEKECGHRSCTACVWNRWIRKVLKSTLIRLKV